MGKATTIDERLSVFLLSDKDLEGNLTATIQSDGAPIGAVEFAKTVIDLVKTLRAIGEATSTDSKKYDWGIIEANVIDDRASFTLRTFPKEMFKAKAKRMKKELE